MEYYNAVATDLGYRFAELVAEYFDRIAELPTASAVRYKNVRCKPMKRFPFLITFAIEEDGSVLYSQVLPKSPIGKAIAYTLPRWDRLSLYATDGRLLIDNNPVENAIRPVALGRKNFLFAGSNDGGVSSPYFRPTGD